MNDIKQKPTFIEALKKLINEYSMEDNSDTPDYILAEFMINSLRAFENATEMRDEHYGDKDKFIQNTVEHYYANLPTIKSK